MQFVRKTQFTPKQAASSQESMMREKPQTSGDGLKPSPLPDEELTSMDTHDDDFKSDQAPDLETLARHIEWYLKEKPFYIVFEDVVERYWPFEMGTESGRETQIQAFAESHGWNAFMHKSDFDRTRAVFLPQ